MGIYLTAEGDDSLMANLGGGGYEWGGKLQGNVGPVTIRIYGSRPHRKALINYEC